MQHPASHRRGGLAAVAVTLLVATAVAACGGAGAGGRLADRLSGQEAPTPATTDAADLEALLLADDPATTGADDPSAIDAELPIDVDEEPGDGQPASGSGSAGSGSTAAGSTSVSTTEASQLLGQVEDLLRQLDTELAAHDDAAITMGE